MLGVTEQIRHKGEKNWLYGKSEFHGSNPATNLVPMLVLTGNFCIFSQSKNTQK